MAMTVWMIRSFLFSSFFWLVTRSGRRSLDVKEEFRPGEGAGSTDQAGASVVYLWSRAASTASTASEASLWHAGSSLDFSAVYFKIFPYSFFSLFLQRESTCRTCFSSCGPSGHRYCQRPPGFRIGLFEGQWAGWTAGLELWRPGRRMSLGCQRVHPRSSRASPVCRPAGP